MGIFSFLGDIFGPISDTIDNLHTSDEEIGLIEVEKSKLKNQLAEIEARVTTKIVELQTKAMEANAKMEIITQQHGNWLGKSWRPLTSLAMASILIAMGFDIVPFKPLMVQVAGGFLGIYGLGRSYEKGNKK